jgi:hypothetical protein
MKFKIGDVVRFKEDPQINWDVDKELRDIHGIIKDIKIDNRRPGFMDLLLIVFEDNPNDHPHGYFAKRFEKVEQKSLEPLLTNQAYSDVWE